jgi:putative FmdB family regulatory protein
MPMYTFKCEKCGRRFDKLSRSTDEKITGCKSCGGDAHREFPPVEVNAIIKGFSEKNGYGLHDEREKK